MRLPSNVQFLVRGAIVALVVIMAAGLLSGPAGFRPAPRSAEAAVLSEVQKLPASDAEAGDNFGFSVAISGTRGIGRSGMAVRSRRSP